MRLEEMIEQRLYDEIWQKYCGYLELSIDEYMEIQTRLLLEQIDLLSKCELGRKVLKDKVPQTIDEFRATIPLTDYYDYATDLINKNEHALPLKPAFWIETTWEGGKYPIKRAPLTQEMLDNYGMYAVAALIMAATDKKKELNIQKNDKLFFGMAPLPYFTGLTPYGLSLEIGLEYLPPLDEAEAVDFKKRNQLGFKLGLRKGIDMLIGISVIIVKIGESLTKQSNKKKSRILYEMTHSTSAMNFKMTRAWLKHKISGKPILPRDLFEIKAILCGGTDSAAFKDKIEYYWGVRPLEVYGGTEVGMVGAESWSKNGMTFYPDVNFFEFIPEVESQRSQLNKDYVPKTLLINEVQPGEVYELVITTLKGGVFVRYRVGDMVKCVALSNPKDNIRLPQFLYLDRISNVIDLAAFTRITQSTIEESIAKTGLPISDWVAIKEYDENKHPKLHIFFESEGDVKEADYKEALNTALSETDVDYQSLIQLLGMDPLRITHIRKNAIAELRSQTETPPGRINPGKTFMDQLTRYTV